MRAGSTAAHAAGSDDAQTMHSNGQTTTGNLASGLEQQTAVSVARCYQCGKCSAGCPMAAEMDHAPSRLLRLLQTGRPQHENAALGSRAIWLCVGCETCVTRCPNEVDLPRAIDFLREQAVARRVAHRDARAIRAFHAAFLAGIERNGRLHELELIARYKLATGALLQDVTVAPAMFLKGKIGLLPHRVRNRKAVARIFERAAAVDARERAGSAALSEENSVHGENRVQDSATGTRTEPRATGPETRH